LERGRVKGGGEKKSFFPVSKEKYLNGRERRYEGAGGKTAGGKKNLVSCQKKKKPPNVITRGTLEGKRGKEAQARGKIRGGEKTEEETEGESGVLWDRGKKASSWVVRKRGVLISRRRGLRKRGRVHRC